MLDTVLHHAQPHTSYDHPPMVGTPQHKHVAACRCMIQLFNYIKEYSMSAIPNKLHKYLLLAEAACLRRASTAMCRAVKNEIPTMVFLWWHFHSNNVRTAHGNLYTFSVKPKWRTVVVWFFTACSSAEVYLRTSLPRGHSTVGVPKRCGGFMAIRLRAHKEFADNRFQLLLYI